MIAGYLFYSKSYKVGNEGEAFEKSIAVLPFVDIIRKVIWNI